MAVGIQRGDDAACIVLAAHEVPLRVVTVFRQCLGLADDPPLAAPRIQCAILELTEPACRLAGESALQRRQVAGDDALLVEPVVFRDADHIVDIRCPLAPAQIRLLAFKLSLLGTQNLVAAESAVGAHRDVRVRPVSAQLRDHLFEQILHSGGGVTGGASQTHHHRKVVTQHQQRHVAVLAVVAVVEPVFLATVQLEVGGIDVKHGPIRRLAPVIDEKLHQQPVEPREVNLNLAVLFDIATGRRQFQPVERALSGQCLAVRTLRLHAAQRCTEKTVLAQMIVIVEVLITLNQRQDALPDQRRQRMHDVFRTPEVVEAVGHAAE